MDAEPDRSQLGDGEGESSRDQCCQQEGDGEEAEVGHPQGTGQDGHQHLADWGGGNEGGLLGLMVVIMIMMASNMKQWLCWC